MIKFFKHFRQRYISEGKTKKYVLYAMGEIVLVVIGILIALSINNWNENRKDLNEEQKIIFSLNEEFKKNLIELDSSIVGINRSLAGIDSILKLMNKTIIIDNKSHSLDKLLSSVINIPRFFPSSFVLKELESSGRLTRLKNTKIKSLLYSWNSKIDKISVAVTVSNKSFDDALVYIKKKGSLRRIDFAEQQSNLAMPLSQSILSESNEHLITDLQFENVVDDQFLLLTYRKKTYLEAKKVIEDIINQTEANSHD